MGKKAKHKTQIKKKTLNPEFNEVRLACSPPYLWRLTVCEREGSNSFRNIPNRLKRAFPLPVGLSYIRGIGDGLPVTDKALGCRRLQEAVFRG